ncbi:MAG TPA: hypothetical protein ENH82_18105 [bacterium]|nr:hypothetical protein [bacterium]
MNIREIVTEWLKNNGYDGLVNDDCGCNVSDLMLCDEPSINCEAGHQRYCNGCKIECEDREEYEIGGCVMEGKKKPNPCHHQRDEG